VDIILYGPSMRAGEPPVKVYITINGDANEFQMLIEKLEAALHGGPQVLELKAANGVPMRLVLDRLGPESPKQ
jgi:hypothetical protein